MTWSAKGALKKSSTPPAPLVALAGGIIPGGGYWLMGERWRGYVVGVTILCLWIMGLLVGGVRIIEVPGYDDLGRPIANARLIEQLRDKPWSIAQVLVGPTAFVSGAVSIYAARPDGASLSMVSRSPVAHARLWEIPVLYTAVAGMLNLITLIDAAHRARHLGSAE